jgi:tetratricopeptide (TPR) repeat protein
MDLSALPPAVISLLIPHLSHLGNRLVERLETHAEEATVGAVGRLYGLLRGRLAREHAEQALHRLEQQPSNVYRQEALKVILAEIISNDTSFAQALDRIVSEAQTTNLVAAKDTSGPVAVGGDIKYQAKSLISRDVNTDSYIVGDHITVNAYPDAGKTVTAVRPTPQVQLPPDISDFTGRDEILTDVLDLLSNPLAGQDTALVISVISGKAGVGKSALAIHIAHKLRTHFPDGQLYVNLRGVEDERRHPADVLNEFLRALGVEGAAVPEHLDDRAARYRSRLNGLRVLVVLDNAADAAQVRPLLPGVASCTVIITSRRRLAGVEGAHHVKLDILEPDQAVELLGKIAGQSRVLAEREEAEKVVNLCGYLPLAVRIAGAKLAAREQWRLSRLVELLQDESRRLSLLDTGDLEVRASFTLSYKGLEKSEQRAFRLLGLLNLSDFAPWVVAALLDTDLSDTEALIGSLVDAQLLEMSARDTVGYNRYQLHDLLRIFARETVQEDEVRSKRQAAVERMLGAYLALAEQADDALEPGWSRDIGQGPAKRWRATGPEVGDLVRNEPLTWFTAERNNLVAAVELACEYELGELAWELTSALAAFFDVHSHWDDWQYTHELALRAVRRVGNRLGEAFTLRNLGRVYRYQNRWRAAIACYDECLPIFRELGDRRGEAATLLNLGDVYRYQGRWKEATSCFDECLPIFRELGDRRGEAISWRSRGNVYRGPGRYSDAIECYERCLPIFRKIGDRRWEAATYLSLGDVYSDQGRWKEAVDCYLRCRPVFEEVGDRHWQALTLRSQGEVHLRRGNLDEALELLGSSLRIFRELGDRHWEAVTKRNLGDVCRERQRFEESLEWFEAALSVFREIGDRLSEGKTLTGLGKTRALRGDETAAAAAWREALTIFQELNVPEITEVRRLLEQA